MAGSHISIPTILKVGKNTLENLGSYLKSSGFKNAVLYFGNGLISMFGNEIMDSLKKDGITVLDYMELDTTKIEDIITLILKLRLLLELEAVRLLTLQSMRHTLGNCLI